MEELPSIPETEVHKPKKKKKKHKRKKKMEQESKDKTVEIDKQSEMELKSMTSNIDETPSISFEPAPKRPGFKKPALTKRVSFTTRKIQRPGSANKFIKDNMLTSGGGALFEEVSENSHGTLRFHGYDNYSGSESVYVKIPYRIHPIRVWEIMTERWQCPVPNLIIALSGESSYESIPPKVKDKFKRGLIKAAATTGAWIVTSGVNSGISEYIGKMMKDHVTSCGGSTSIVTLGITSWQSINKNEQLISKTKGHSTPTCIDYDKMTSSKQDLTQELDNNHTHFILVDDESKPNDEIGFESKFENFLSGTVQIPGARSETVGSQIPFIRILIDGGLDNLKTAVESVKSNIPVIVLDGSGKAANLVADIYRNADKLSDSGIRDMVNQHNLSLDEKETKQCVELIKTITENKAHLQMLNIFHVHEFETKDFDKVILESLLKARESNATAKLLVSLAWNRSDIAEKQIFIPQNKEILKMEKNSAEWSKIARELSEFLQFKEDKKDGIASDNFKIELGGNRYVEKGENNQIILCKYGQSNQRLEFPLCRWKAIELTFEEIDRTFGELQKGGDAQYASHLGGNVYVSISKDYPFVNIRQFWKPNDCDVVKPTRKGVCLNFAQFQKLKDASKVLPDFIAELGDCLPCWMGDDHLNQLGFIYCTECNPNGEGCFSY